MRPGRAAGAAAELPPLLLPLLPLLMLLPLLLPLLPLLSLLPLLPPGDFENFPKAGALAFAALLPWLSVRKLLGSAAAGRETPFFIAGAAVAAAGASFSSPAVAGAAAVV